MLSCPHCVLITSVSAITDVHVATSAPASQWNGMVTKMTDGFHFAFMGRRLCIGFGSTFASAEFNYIKPDTSTLTH